MYEKLKSLALKNFNDDISYKLFKLYRFFLKEYLFFSQVFRVLKKPRNISNIFHASIQKTGSQWIKTIFRDPYIKSITGMPVFPQHRYEYDEFIKKFPKKTFIPCLYISYDLFEEIKKPKSYKTFYVIRNPLDLTVSWYFSIKNTHLKMGKVPYHRKKLKDLNQEEGINYSIKALSMKYMSIRNWMEKCDDENVKFIKFEDLVTNPLKELKELFDFCNIKYKNSLLSKCLEKYTKSKMREKDRSMRNSSHSHYRKKRTNHQEIFTDKNYEYFYNVTGNLMEILGY